MTESDVRNHFYNHKATEVICLKSDMGFFINPHDAYSWTTVQMGEHTFVMTTEGVYVGNLTTGEMSTIINSEIMMNGGAVAHGAMATPHIESAHFDGQDLHLHSSDGISNSINLSSIVDGSPYITNIDNNVQTVMGTVTLQNTMIEDLKNQLENLQTKRKRITFAKQHKYKLK